MAVVYPREGRLADLNRLLSLTSAASFTVRLFKSNTTPDVDSVLADFTEADFSGYASVPVSFTTPVADGDDNGLTVFDPALFIRGAGATDNDIYGWLLECVDSAVTVVIAVERYADAPRPMVLPGSSILVTVSKTQGACP